MKSPLLPIVLACGALLHGPAVAQGAGPSPEGAWRGTLACSEGAGPTGSLQAYTVPFAFTVTGRLGVVKTDTDELIEQTAVWFEDRSTVRVEVAGVRKNAPDRSWSIRAEGPVANGRFRVEAPMFRADGRTLVRRACVFDARQAAADGRASPAAPVNPAATPTSAAAPPVPVPAPASPRAAPPAASAPPALNTLSAEDWARLMAQGTQDPKRLQELVDFLAGAEAAMRDRGTSRERFESIAAQEARVALALLNSAGGLDLNVHLDKLHPGLKRDLSGAATLGDGRVPVRVLLLDTRTRVATRGLVDSAALTLLAATEPAKLQQDNRELVTSSSPLIRDNPARTLDQRVYLAQLTQKVRDILAAKGIKLASLPDSARSTPDLSIVVADATEGARSQGLQAIGRDHALVITFDAQLEPDAAVEAALLRSAGRPGENNRERAAITELAQGLQARLKDPRFERLASITTEELAAARAQ